MRVSEGTWVEIGGFWATQTSLQNWLVVTERGNLDTVVGGISRMGSKWYAAYLFHSVHDAHGAYLGDSGVPTIVGWGDDLVGAATGSGRTSARRTLRAHSWMRRSRARTPRRASSTFLRVRRGERSLLGAVRAE